MENVKEKTEKVFFPFNKEEYDKCKVTCNFYSDGGRWVSKEELESLLKKFN